MIRNANLNDVKKIRLVKPELGEEVIKDRLIRQGRGEVEFLVMEIDMEIVGFVLLKWQGKKTHPEYPDIEDLYIKSNHRSMGYGSILINKCEELTRTRAIFKIGLAVNPDENCKAHKLYEKLGYKTTNEQPYVDGIYNGVEDWCVDMVKEII